MTSAEMYARGYSDALSVKSAGLAKEVGKFLGGGLLGAPRAVSAVRVARSSPQWGSLPNFSSKAKFLWNASGPGGPTFGDAMGDFGKGALGFGTTLSSLIGTNAWLDHNPDPIPAPTAEELAAHAEATKDSPARPYTTSARINALASRIKGFAKGVTSSIGSLSPGEALAVAATAGVGGVAGIYALYSKLRKGGKKKVSKTVEVG